MSASVSLSDLFWSKPDGTPLFSGLTLTFGPERTGVVGRNGTGKSTLLRLISGDLSPISGQVQITGSVAMMRQDAVVGPNETIADLLGVRRALDLLDRAEAGLADADDLADADWTLPARIEAALMRCGLSAGLQTALVTLSGGQRSRAALAALILAEPDFLLLDEPTNNLDRAGRRAVIDLVRGWTGGAIVVSHDRTLLEEMDAIVELTSLGATRYGGNYSAFRERKDSELDAAARDLAHAEKTRSETARRAQQAAERKARKDSAGHRARARGDQPKILMDAAKGRAEASGGAGARLRDARREAAEEALSAAREKIEVLQPLRMDIPPTGLSPGKTVLRLDGVAGGYDPGCPVIRDLSLTLTGPERVVIAGPNGSGKGGGVALARRLRRRAPCLHAAGAGGGGRRGVRRRRENRAGRHCRLAALERAHLLHHRALDAFTFGVDARPRWACRLRGANMAQAKLYAAIARDGTPSAMIPEKQIRAELYETIGLGDFEELDASLAPEWIA